VREQVDERHRSRPVARGSEQADIARQRGRIARHQHDPIRVARGHGAGTVLAESRPARVGDHDVRLRSLPAADIRGDDARRKVAEVVLGVGDRGAPPLHRDHATRIVDRGREESDPAVQVDDGPVAADRVANQAGERLGPVGAALEERVDRDAKRPAVDHFVHARRRPLFDVGRQVERRSRRIGAGRAFTGRGRDSQRHLAGAAEARVA